MAYHAVAPAHSSAESVQPSEHRAKLLLTVTEAAAQLGVCRTVMYRLIQTGEVPSVRIGRLRRIRPEDLVEYTANLPPDRPQSACSTVAVR